MELSGPCYMVSVDSSLVEFARRNMEKELEEVANRIRKNALHKIVQQPFF